GLAALALVAVGGPWWLRHRRAEPPPARAVAAPTRLQPAAATAAGDASPPTFAPVAIARPSLPAETAGLSDEDRAEADRLLGLLEAKMSVEAADLQAGEGLRERYPDEPSLRNLLG